MNRLAGDTVPTVTITAILSPPAQQNAQPSKPKPKAKLPDLPHECADAACAAAAAVWAVQQTSSDDTGKSEQQQEMSLTLLGATYAQVHSLYTFNIATGMIYSTLRNPTWSRVESAAPAGCTSGSASSCASPEMYTTIQNPAPRPIDPALLFTVYLFGNTGTDGGPLRRVLGRFDAERKSRLSDLIPEPSVGLSLSSPATDFFGGGSSEVWRGVQFVYGLHWGKVNYLAPVPTSDPTSSAAPVIDTHFGTGFFAGVTFNITFIQTLFGGGKGGGGGGQ
jgi:hypothetical protein